MILQHKNLLSTQGTKRRLGRTASLIFQSPREVQVGHSNGERREDAVAGKQAGAAVKAASRGETSIVPRRMKMSRVMQSGGRECLLKGGGARDWIKPVFGDRG